MKKMIAVAVLMTLVATTLIGCGKKDSQAGDTSLEYIKDNGKLLLGLDSSFPPMGFTDENQEIVGFDVDVAKEVAKKMGVELELVPISWDAKEQELATKQIDCIWNGFTKNAEREEKMSLSVPYMKNTQVAVVLASSNITSLEGLADKVVVIQNGSTASDAMDRNKEFTDSLKELVKVDNNVQALMDLKTGGSDAVVMDEVVARYYTEKEAGVYTVIEESLADEEYVVGFRKGETALTDEVNKYLKELAADGTLKAISEKWMGKDITTVE